MKCDVLIAGAGAAGLMCASEAARRGRRVIILEHGKPGRKVLVSGGGRANFTNLNVSAENYLSENPHFTKSALAGFPPSAIIQLLESHGVQSHEEESGKMFLDGRARQLLDLLVRRCNDSGAAIITGVKIGGIRKKAGRFSVNIEDGQFDAESLVVATGGLSYPELGATNLGFKIAERFGLRITPARPALVPFIFNQEDMKRYGGLSGISLETVIRYESKGKKKLVSGETLFTHKGLSGPAILQASLYWTGGGLSIDLLPGMDLKNMLVKDRAQNTRMHNYLSGLLPRRLAMKWCELFLNSKPLNQYPARRLEKAADELHNWAIQPSGTEGYKTAEVTAGGVDTKELSSRTMESVKAPGLFFAGEVMDVTGQLGGFNLHWAWASGFAAGRNA